MRILFDMITVCRRTGAGEYVRRVFHTLFDVCQKEKNPISLICLYDSSRGIAYDDLQPEQLCGMGLSLADAKGADLSQLVASLHIDRLFIGCAQYWWQYKGLDKVTCEVICVIHDLSHQEKWQNHIDEYGKLRKAALPMFYSVVRLRRRKGHNFLIDPTVRLANNNPKVQLVAVSNYTRSSIEYQLGICAEQVRVLFSPLRLPTASQAITQPLLQQLIVSGRRYYMIVGCGTGLKNSRTAIPAFIRMAQKKPGLSLLAVGLKGEVSAPCITAVPFLSDGDLEQAYAHCHALIYPSLFEGFGYPPVEAFRHGKPVLCSNVCSMPEVLGDAPIYFSPFYETAVFNAVQQLEAMDDAAYGELCERSRRQYLKIAERQERDLGTLLEMLTLRP